MRAVYEAVLEGVVDDFSNCTPLAQSAVLQLENSGHLERIDGKVRPTGKEFKRGKRKANEENLERATD
jgi:hypothetical protein